MKLSDIKEKVIILKITKTYKENMPDKDVFGITRRAWRINIKRKIKAEYAFGLFNNKIVGVYTIKSWHKDKINPKRWEFDGERASDFILDKYLNKELRKFWKRGQSNPVKYINC